MVSCALALAEFAKAEAGHPKTKSRDEARTVRTAPVEGSFTAALWCWFLGCVVVYTALFGTGYLLYGRTPGGIVCMAVAAVGAVGIFRALPRIGFD